MRCENCQGEIYKDADSVWAAWHSLFCAVSVLNSEGTITDQTREDMYKHLLTLKHVISEEAERETKRGQKQAKA